jgi:DNA repair exonuclease SbcCD nuclease subunit
VTARPHVRLLHVSDVHLGMHDGADPRARKDSEAAFQAVIDLGLRERVDLMVVAGDFFDHARVFDSTLEFAAEQLARLHAPVIIVPGNHDHAGSGSVYDRMDARMHAPHVTVVRAPDGEVIRLDRLSLVVWARAYHNQGPAFAPFHGAPRRHGSTRQSAWSVGVGHGHYVAAGESTEASFRFTDSDIADLDFDYIALGHWERHAVVGSARVTAAYSGTPRRSDGAPGTALVVDLESAGEISVAAHEIQGGTTPTVAQPGGSEKEEGASARPRLQS